MGLLACLMVQGFAFEFVIASQDLPSFYSAHMSFLLFWITYVISSSHHWRTSAHAVACRTLPLPCPFCRVVPRTPSMLWCLPFSGPGLL